MRLMRTCVLAGVVLCGASGVLHGCGAPAEPEVLTPQVDPRFASAETMLDYYNRLATADPQDVHGIMAIFYAENDLQRELISLTGLLLPTIELEHEAWVRFGKPPQAPMNEPPLSPDEPAKMTQVEDFRAQAQYRDKRRRHQTLYFVKIGDRWWLSGYTLERDPDVMELFSTPEARRIMGESLRRASGPTQAVLARLRAGEFSSLSQLQAALNAAMR